MGWGLSSCTNGASFSVSLKVICCVRAVFLWRRLLFRGERRRGCPFLFLSAHPREGALLPRVVVMRSLRHFMPGEGNVAGRVVRWREAHRAGLGCGW